MTTTPKTRSFVVSYDPVQDQLVVFSLADADIAPLVAAAFKAYWPLASLNHQLTGDVAQRLGTTALSVLGLYNPILRPMLKPMLQAPRGRPRKSGKE